MLFLVVLIIGIVVQTTQITAAENDGRGSRGSTCELRKICGRVRRLERKLEDKIEELERLVRNVKNNCVTNIRLTDPQNILIWRGSGAADTNGWVITGATNWNKDDYLDYVDRRRVEKEVNGVWSAIA